MLLGIKSFVSLGVVQAPSTNLDAKVDDRVHLIVGVTASGGGKPDTDQLNSKAVRASGASHAVPTGLASRRRHQVRKLPSEGIKHRAGVEGAQTVDSPPSKQLEIGKFGSGRSVRESVQKTRSYAMRLSLTDK